MYILAVVHSSGVYEGNPYDNVLFHCFTEQDELPKGLLAGSPVETVKLKTSIVENCLGSLSSVNWQDFVGGEILPVYNKFGQAKSFSVSPNIDNSDKAVAAVDVPAVSDKSPEDSDEAVNKKPSKK